MDEGDSNVFGHMAPEIIEKLLWLYTKRGQRQARRDVIALSQGPRNVSGRRDVVQLFLSPLPALP